MPWRAALMNSCSGFNFHFLCSLCCIASQEESRAKVSSGAGLPWFMSIQANGLTHKRATEDIGPSHPPSRQYLHTLGCLPRQTSSTTSEGWVTSWGSPSRPAAYLKKWPLSDPWLHLGGTDAVFWCPVIETVNERVEMGKLNGSSR